MAAFQEVFRRSGIDERRSPPGMVVPFGGSNIVALIDPGRKLKVDPNAHALGIKERAGPGCLDSAPLDLSGFLPGYAERGALRFCRCVGRA